MNVIRSLDKALERRSRNAILFATLGLAILLGALDSLLPADVLILYIVPVYAATWYGGRRVGNVVAVYCAGAWLLSSLSKAGLFRGEALQTDSLWAFVARFLVFLVIVQVVARLRETMRQQQELTRFIVHDLRSPISSSITGLMTLQQSQKSLSETDREMVELALVSNQRALSLVTSILDVAKLEGGQMSVDKQPCDIETLVESSIEVVRLWAKSNEIEVRTDIGIGNWSLDEHLTSRILINILSNALKFSPPGSCIQLKASRAPHHQIEFSVADQGQGIPEDFLESIFRPFEQVKGTRGGTGLGLTFCRLAVQAQGGRIWAESALGKGTTIRFTLPQ